MKDTTNADLTIKATGYQWKWGYDYLKGSDGVSFFSTLPRRAARSERAPRRRPNNYLLEVDNPLVVPINKKVRIIITANDVIHAWWVPVFGVKQDAIPGFVRDSWFRSKKHHVISNLLGSSYCSTEITGADPFRKAVRATRST